MSKVVIFERQNVAIKRKKMHPCPDFVTVGYNDNSICLFVENGNVYLKVSNPRTGSVYINSLIQSMANPALNKTNPMGMHIILVNHLVKLEPSAYTFVFSNEEDAAVCNACLSLATMAAKANEGLSLECEKVESLEGSGEESLGDDEEDEFPATQDFNVGAREYAEELLASYKDEGKL